VFGDLRVLTPVEVLHYTCHAERRHNGAYRLVSTRQAHSFDAVFGRRLPLRAAGLPPIEPPAQRQQARVAVTSAGGVPLVP
jgi:hypothetical protein